MTIAGAIAGRLARIDDGKLVRAVFFGMLIAAGAILYVDYRELTLATPAGALPSDQPILPAFDPDSPGTAPGPDVTTDPELLQQPLVVRLTGGGVLTLTGTIDPGSAARVAEEVAAHGEYIKTVALDSPGGSVTDALEIGTLLRGKGYATSVAAGALCASSCPLIFMGGTERVASPQAAIGVHQIYAATAPGSLAERLQAAGTAMADAQKLTAAITRYVADMGVEQEVWLHALETPPERLYYFSADELVALKLATKLST
ncbi:MAG: ATP-dependent Clp protease proteolytic subunit [Devosia sp.]